MVHHHPIVYQVLVLPSSDEIVSLSPWVPLTEEHQPQLGGQAPRQEAHRVVDLNALGVGRWVWSPDRSGAVGRFAHDGKTGSQHGGWTCTK